MTAPAAGHGHDHGHGHSHGLVDRSIVRSRAGVKAVAITLAVLGAATIVQLLIFVLSGSVALLADLIRNAGDSLTAVPLGIAFFVRSARAERLAGLAVVLAIFVSACVALYETILRLVHPAHLSHLWALAAAGLVGFVGNEVAAQIRLKAGRRLDSAALTADGNHARIDGFVSLGVVASAAVVGLGVPVADPIVGLVITVVILKITWDSWRTVRAAPVDVAHVEPAGGGRVMHGAFGYDVLFWLISRGRERAFRDELVALARLQDGESVLDVGCGTGTLAIAAKRRVGPSGSVHGIDPAPEMVARSRKKARRQHLEIAFEAAGAEALPFPDGSFDVVLCTTVLHHLPHDLLPGSVAEMRRVLGPGGRVLLVDIGGPQTGRRTLHAPQGDAPAGRPHFDLDRVIERLDTFALRPIETGTVAARLIRLEGLRSVLAGAEPL